MIDINLLYALMLSVINYVRLNNKKNEPAKENEYSDDNLYTNISPFKHDIFKQLILDSIPLLIFYLLSNKKLVILNINNLDEFYESIIGKFIITTLSFIIYYHVIQPYIVNNINNF